MTVCIAALYGGGAGVVLVSDRMVTAHFPIGYEFEHQENTKIIALDGADSVHVMISGDVLRGNEILDMAKGQLALREGVSAPRRLRARFVKPTSRFGSPILSTGSWNREDWT